ncbi:class I SAM-dependent methyltransferase [Holophaga foetida]|uniref:class I SAM-dependent methyltransferase n=1 Tax=Holophaga foetida TaxID=35839 RepID=UPI00024749F6|nr:class I SAM-dependent methyltransferase [Holophaga foetida]
MPTTPVPSDLPSAHTGKVIPVIRPCPVCGGGASTLLRRLELMVPESLRLQNSFAIMACSDCGAVFHDVQHQDDRESYYETYTGSESLQYEVMPDQAAFNDMTLRFLEQAGLEPEKHAIADIGCSFGITLLALKERGFKDLFAIDPDRAAIRYLASQGVPGRHGLATEELPELEGRFDLIILRHVLEHLESPLQAIRNVVKWLKPEGRIYIELPDLSRYRQCAPFPGFFFEFEHINHFSLVSLMNLMREFSLVRCESTPDIYPCMRALFEKSTLERKICHSAADASFVEDCLLHPSGKGGQVLANIQSLGDREIALWGVSVFVYRMLTHTPLKHCSIRHLVDSNPQRQGEKIMGLTVKEPESLRSFRGDIVICGENSMGSIQRAVRAMGLDNRVVCLMETQGADSFDPMP